MFELVPDVHQSGLWRSWVEKSLGLNFCRMHFMLLERLCTHERNLIAFPGFEATWQAGEI